MRPIHLLIVLTFGAVFQVEATSSCVEIFSNPVSQTFSPKNVRSTEKISDQWTLAKNQRTSGELTVVSHSSHHTIFSGPSARPYTRNIISDATRGFRSSIRFRTEELEPNESNFIKSESSLFQETRESSQRMAKFLSEQYPRRRWDSDFNQRKVANPAGLDRLLPQSYRAEVFSPEGLLIGSGVIVYSPFLVIRNLETNKKSVLPWMDGMELKRRLDTESLSNTVPNPLRLPVEDFFGFEVLRSNGVSPVVLVNANGKEFRVSTGIVAELASFAIDKASPFRNQILEELYYEFIMASYHTPYRVHEKASLANLAMVSQTPQFQRRPLFITYGETVGQRLYRSEPFNFSVADGVSRESHGVNWTPLVNDANFLANFAQRKNFMAVANRAFDELSLLGVPIESPSNKYPVTRSMSEELADIYHQMEFRKKFGEENESRLVPLLLNPNFNGSDSF